MTHVFIVKDMVLEICATERQIVVLMLVTVILVVRVEQMEQQH